MKALFGWMGLAAVLCVSPLAGAADVSGTWKGAFDANGQTLHLTLNLKADGPTLTGTVTTEASGTKEIHEGKLDGEAISFWMNAEYQGTTYKVVYKGKVAGDHIDFTLGTEDGSWGTDVAVKKEAAAVTAGADAAKAPDANKVADVTGAWKGTFDANGTNTPIVLNLKSAGAEVKGTAEGFGPAPLDIHDGKVDGNVVTFSVNTEYQGHEYVLNFKGPVSGDQIEFACGTSGGEWGTTVTVKR